MFKTSLYTIFIPLEDSENEWMLVHGYSGAIDIVNDAIALFLRKGGTISESQIEQSEIPFKKQSLELLIKRGYLTNKTPTEEKLWVTKMANYLHSTKTHGANFCFLVAYDCNFRCPYCFENGISNNGKGWSKKTFTKDSVDRAFEAMIEIEPTRTKISNGITLYGGEPLLKRNLKLVEYIVNKGIENGYFFSAITNGYELEHFKDLLNSKMINNVQITIDGPKKVHDTRRTHYKDGSTYDTIMKNVQLCLDNNVFVSIRVNTEVNNFDNLFQLNQDLTERGFFNYKNFTVYSGLIHGDEQMSCNVVMSPEKVIESGKKYAKAFGEIEVKGGDRYDPDAQYINFDAEEKRLFNQDTNIQFHYQADVSLPEQEVIRTMNRSEYLNKFKEAYKKSPDLKISCQDFGLPGKVLHVLRENNLFNFQSTFCGAQTGMYILDPCGDIYACWELVGQDQYIIGSYKDEIVFDIEAVEKWQGKNISKVDACSKCKYAFFCGGGCMAGALREGRGYNSPHCDGYPKLFQQLVPDTYNKYLLELERQKNGEKIEKIETHAQII
ncbi:radical SAM protein [Ferruginibacter sp.]|nr:radical SAM protein [Ferruginibacter sp.]